MSVTWNTIQSAPHTVTCLLSNCYILPSHTCKVEQGDRGDGWWRYPSWFSHDDVIKWKHFPRRWPLCGKFTGPGEFPAQRPATRSFDVFFDLRLNTRLSKQPWGWWFETPAWSLWRHRNELHDDNYNLSWLDLGIPTSFCFTYIRNWKSSFQLDIHHCVYLHNCPLTK